MYTTIEADIKDGRVSSPELRKLPAVAHVLITWLPRQEEKATYDFSALAGRLKWSGNAIKEQRKIRDEW
ncbi:MAG: hypothetical protein J0651_01045 [Actinobacteria bacterium]|jgi:hypothetical protein|nr:hypothetical protein [Actinomycetota bacterium]